MFGMLIALACPGLPDRKPHRALQPAGSIDAVMDALESEPAATLANARPWWPLPSIGANGSVVQHDAPCVGVLGLQRSGTNLMETIMANCGVASCLPADAARGTAQWKARPFHHAS